MRVQTAVNADSAAELAEFSDFLLSIREGRYPVNSEIGPDDICLPRDMCLITEKQTHTDDVGDDEDMPNFDLLPPQDELPVAATDGHEVIEEDSDVRSINALIDTTYPDLDRNDLRDEYFADRAILALTNSSVHRINEMAASRLSGKTREYLSLDSVEGVDSSFFEEEFLNSLNFSGIPPHKIILKVGAPIIMIRNLNSSEGLCNGTRLRVVSLRDKCIDAVIMVGPRRGQRVFIPRIIFFSDDDDKEFPFQLRRKQFPVVPAFAMTINKAQGQSIHHVGVYLRQPVFAHGQLYVALSRVTSRGAIKIVLDENDVDESGAVHTSNVVYQQIFSDN